MSSKLKKFVSEHRQAFDSDEPGKDLWNKIDARIEEKNTSRISSSWLSKFKYLAFWASLLIIAVYFIAKSFPGSSANKMSVIKNDSAILTSGKEQKGNQKSGSVVSELNTAKAANNLSGTTNRSQNSLLAEQRTLAVKDSIVERGKEIFTNVSTFEPTSSNPEKNNTENSLQISVKDNVTTNTNLTNEKKEHNSTKKIKKPALYIPEDPEKINYYTATLYESSSLCAVIRAYKFPGKVGLGDGDVTIPRHYKLNLKIISCSHLESTNTIKAVWLKGKTDDKITLSLKDGFKNIVLLKSNGRKLHPEAVSHYYQGRGAISGYSGRRFSMVFKRKMELILFFKNAEVGDKILVNGVIEAIITGQP